MTLREVSDLTAGDGNLYTRHFGLLFYAADGPFKYYS